MIHSKVVQIASIVVSLSLFGCTGSPLVDRIDPYAEARRVAPVFQATDALYAESIPCVVILDPIAADGLGDAELGEAVARQVSTRFDRVIRPVERRRLEQSRSLDPGHPEDLRRLAEAVGCGYAMSIVESPPGSVYALFWTRQTIGLTLTLRRVSDREVLWQASSEAARSDGGLPLSPLSALINAAEAGSMAADPELRASLTDDALRRIVGTLPEFRRSSYPRDRIAQRYGFQ
jgi:hypothetical protein